MKKYLPIIVAFLMIATLLAGCTSSSSSSKTTPSSNNPTLSVSMNQGIQFQYFYRGFTAVSENNTTFNEMLGTHIIQTDANWHDFMGKFCPGIPYYIPVDFSSQCLVAQVMNGAKPNYNESFDIKSITIDNSTLNIQGSFDTSTSVYALNPDGYENYFINIVVVNKSDLPSTISGIYTSSNQSSLKSSSTAKASSISNPSSADLIQIINNVSENLKKKYPDIEITNEWLGEKCLEYRYVVLFGALKSDSRQGVAQVIRFDPDCKKVLSQQRYLQPEKHGALKVYDTGAKPNEMEIEDSDGNKMSFLTNTGFKLCVY